MNDLKKSSNYNFTNRIQEINQTLTRILGRPIRFKDQVREDGTVSTNRSVPLINSDISSISVKKNKVPMHIQIPSPTHVKPPAENSFKGLKNEEFFA